MKIIFLGIQGSGKSTQAKNLALFLNVPYIEMGQILREKSQKADAEGLEIKQALDAGNLVSDQITVRTLNERIKEHDCQNGFILDGYPRNYAQLEGLPSGLDKVFYIKISDEEGQRRLLARVRGDDTLDVISRRMEIFHQQTEPLIKYFKEKGILEEINGEKTKEEVQKDIIEKIEAGTR